MVVGIALEARTCCAFGLIEQKDRRVTVGQELVATRLVAITGYGQPEDRLRVQESGFHDHLIKPVSPARLARSIAGLPGVEQSLGLADE
jgi:CheY-like chemotaxis protein